MNQLWVKPRIWSNTQVIALFELDADPAAIKEHVQQHFVGTALTAWLVEEIADQAWERAGWNFINQ